MTAIPIFDPFRTFSTANESEASLPLEISYHAEEPSSLIDGDAYSSVITQDSDDDNQLFMQQLDDLNAMFPTPDEIDEYQEKFNKQGGVCRGDIVALESKYPGLFSNIGFSLENYSYLPSKRCLSATVESMELMKSISLVIVVIGGLVKLVTWLGLFEQFGDDYSDDTKKVLSGKDPVERYLKNILNRERLEKFLGENASDETIETIAKFFGLTDEEAAALVKRGKLSDILANSSKGPYKRLAATPIMTDGERLLKYLNGIRESLTNEKEGVKAFIEGLAKGVFDVDKNNHSVDTDDSLFDMKKLPEAPNGFIVKMTKACGLQTDEVVIKNYVVKKLTEAEYDEFKKNINMPKKPEKTYEASKLTVIDDVDKLAAAVITFLITIEGLVKTLNIGHLKKELKTILAKYKEKANKARAKIGDSIKPKKPKNESESSSSQSSDSSSGGDNQATESKMIWAIEAVNTSGADGSGPPPEAVGNPNGSLDIDNVSEVAKNSYTKLYNTLKEISSQITTILSGLGDICHKITKFYDNINKLAAAVAKKAKHIEEPK